MVPLARKNVGRVLPGKDGSTAFVLWAPAENKGTVLDMAAGLKLWPSCNWARPSKDLKFKEELPAGFFFGHR